MIDVTEITISKLRMIHKVQVNAILTKEQIQQLCAKEGVTYLHSRVVKKAI